MIAPLAAFLLALGLAASPAAAADAAVAFERLAAVRGEGLTALAFDPEGGRYAIGDASGAETGGIGGAARAPRRELRSGPVRDLAFLPASLDRERPLLVAGERGLLRVGPDGRIEALAVGAGELARQATRLAVASGAVAVATAAGAFVSGDGRSFQRLAGAPAGAVEAVALGAGPEGLECWASYGGRVFRAALEPGAAGFAAGPSERVAIPLAGAGAGPSDLLLGPPGAAVVAVYPHALAVRREAGGPWRVERPQLPPGAQALRLAFALGRWWLATDRGLLEAEALEGPWRRAAPPAGGAATRAVAGDALAVLAATDRGLLLGGRPPAAADPGRAVRTPEPSGDPEIGRVHRAALGYLGLDPSRMAGLRRGVDHRGWLPVVSFGVGMDRDESRGTDFDETFTSGATRSLVDRDRGRSAQLDLVLDLSWDLGGLRFHPDAIDVSREERAVIELRDDVLDEITHLYFERRRAVAEFAALGDRGTPEAVRLRLRAAELAAGIDAWTGGWFSRNAAPLPP